MTKTDELVPVIKFSLTVLFCGAVVVVAVFVVVAVVVVVDDNVVVSAVDADAAWQFWELQVRVSEPNW